jgi:hypothetical protein
MPTNVSATRTLTCPAATFGFSLRLAATQYGAIRNAATKHHPPQFSTVSGLIAS